MAKELENPQAEARRRNGDTVFTADSFQRAVVGEDVVAERMHRAEHLLKLALFARTVEVGYVPADRMRYATFTIVTGE